MSEMVKIENLKNLIIEIREQKVLLDSDVAHLYGVETKRINEAVKNNPDKFPQDYLFEISKDEFADLRSKNSTAKFAKTRVAPKVFTEKGLYMLATIHNPGNSLGRHSGEGRNPARTKIPQSGQRENMQVGIHPDK
jgi:hypothetical protein